MALDRSTTDVSPEASCSNIRVLHRAVSGWRHRVDMTDPSPSASRNRFVR